MAPSKFGKYMSYQATRASDKAPFRSLLCELADRARDHYNNNMHDPDLNRNATNYRDNHIHKYTAEIILHFINGNY